MSNNNRDPLDEILAKHAAASGTSSTNSTYDDTQDLVNDINYKGEEINYGDNDLADEIAAEEAADEEARRIAASDMMSKIDEKNARKPFMPPDEKDMTYHDEAIGFQSEKISIVSGMVNKVVAKYRLVSGGIPDMPVPELNVMGRMAVMGELVDIYHNSGEKITAEFEDTILKNWIMPDNTLAINNINDAGVVVDKTIMNTASTEQTQSTETLQKYDVKLTQEKPVININVEPNTPVTINVDESIIPDITKSNQIDIHVREVSEQELLKTTIVENSNQEGIINVYDSGINDVPLTLPLSGYRCVMRPINWFDFIKLTAPTSQNGSDNELKKWSVIYEHMKNPSIGEFENFEDFMKKTKYQDRELLMWGLLVATADDEETLSITCGNPKCKHQIKVKYSPRTIVHVDEENIPEWYNASHDAAVGHDAYKIWESVNGKRKRYRLPNTGIIAEINEPSAYEFVTKKLPLIQELYQRYRPEGNMTDLDPRDPSMAEFDYLSTNALFVSALTIVRNEQNGHKEYRFTNWEDIEKIITTALDAGDSGILLKIIEQSRNNVSPISFRVEDINCPMCGKHEEYIPINDIGNSLLFQVSRRLSNTEINLIEMD